MTRKTLTDAQVMRIRKQAAAGVDYKELAEQYDKATNYIASIARGTAYKSVGGPVTLRRPRRKAERIRREPDSSRKERATASTNGRPMPSDFAAMSIDDAARFLQALAVEWPKVRASFLLLDSIIGKQSDA